MTGWGLGAAAADVRCGRGGRGVGVQSARGRARAEGEAYVFSKRAGTRIKLLCCDRHGSWWAVLRLHQGRFVWPRAGKSAWTLSAEQFAWLCAGVDWRRLSTQPIADAYRL